MAQLMYEYALNHQLIEADKKFLIVNCSEYANNPELLTANLFGHKKAHLPVRIRIIPVLLNWQKAVYSSWMRCIVCHRNVRKSSSYLWIRAFITWWEIMKSGISLLYV